MAITIIVVGIVAGLVAVGIALVFGVSYWAALLLYPFVGTLGALVVILCAFWRATVQDRSSHAPQIGF